jgi:8-oxo-dGTP pyrophosphatase MutT (NUDIX family)
VTATRPHVGIGVVVTDDLGRVLVGHRVKAGESPTWCLPGGHLEAGEAVETGAAREVHEETGLVVVGPRVLAVAVYFGGSNVTFAVAARATSTDARLTEPDVFDEWTWAAPDALPAPLFAASGVVVAAWRETAAPAGWTVYPVARP